MADVFLSYSSHDKERARLVAQSLQAAGFSVWWDRDLRPGERLHAVIKQAIENAKAVVVLWTAQSVASHWVCEEAEEARERQTIVPLLMDDLVEPPMGFALIHAARLHDWDGQPTHPEWQEVVDVVGTMVGRPVTATYPRTLPIPPLQHRLRSRLEGVTQALSYVSAAGTLFQAAANWEETVNFVVDHAVASLICLLALAALFASTLLQGLQLRLPRWKANPPEREQIGAQVRPESADRRPVSVEPDKPRPTPAPSRPRQPPWWKRSILAVGSLVTVLALGVVIILLYLSTTGVHYVLLESTPTYDQAVQRTDEVNRMLESSGEVLRARPQRPHFSNPNCAVLLGPYFSRSAAEETLTRLRKNPTYKVRSDAWVVSYSLTDAKKVAARFLGWKVQ